MPNDIDGPPVYDPLTRDHDYLSDIWMTWFTTFIGTVTDYLSQNGIFIPQLTTTQRDALQSPVDGQIIYNSTVPSFQVRLNGAWKTITVS
jgi:hypothetical protein